MIQRNDFIMNFSAHVLTNTKVEVTLVLTNNSPNNYYISYNSIWKTPFHGSLPFNITGESIIPCFPAPTFHNSNTNAIKIDSGQSVSNVVDLSHICLFSRASPGHYTIKGSSQFFLYQDIESFNKGIFSKPQECVNLNFQASFVLIDEDDVQDVSQVVTGSNSNNYNDML